MKTPSFKKLSLDTILSSIDIQKWLEQFDDTDKKIAVEILAKLKFISRDNYAEWLKEKLIELEVDYPCAFFAVRKFDDPKSEYLWTKDGNIVSRPGTSLGSEDLAISVIADLKKKSEDIYLDHPSIEELRSKNVHNIVLIDDSSGSGDRISAYIQSLFKNKTLMSWWSGGRINLHIVTYSITEEAKKNILEKTPGSDHQLRKYPKESKIFFHSNIAFSSERSEFRWGKDFKNILEFCEKVKTIPKWARKGYGDVMSNIVFYHSVPNNLPGILWFESSKWNALFPKRSLPTWVAGALDGTVQTGKNILNSPIFFEMIGVIKKGVRRESSIAIRLELDIKITKKLLAHAKKIGLITEHCRMTDSGMKYWKRYDQEHEDSKCFDKSMYIPLKWSLDRFEVQPSTSKEEIFLKLTESADDSSSEDGEVGQASLEKSDAKTTTSSNSVVPQQPSVSRVDHDTIGPSDSKES